MRVVAPPVLGSYRGHPAVLADLLRAYHDDLLQAVDGQQVWPFLELADPYPEMAAYYSPIGEILGIDPALLTGLSRHRLFLATEPIERGGRRIRGLSGVESLLGYGYPPETSTESPPADSQASSTVEQARTGSADLDALTVALLVFKEDGLSLARSLDAESLHQVLCYANAQLKASQDAQDSAPIQPETPESLPALDDPDVARTLVEAGIPLPGKF
jgi:hypothetical protein